MPALLQDSGSCPICDREVPRIVSKTLDAMREVYACPDHGPVGYGPQPISLKSWVERIEDGPIPAALARFQPF